MIVDLDVGGAEVALYRLLTAKGARATEHAVVSLTTLGPIGHRLTEQGVAVHVLGMRGGLDLFKAGARLYRILRWYQPDVVQTWMYHADLVGGLAARLAGVKRIIWGIRTLELDAGAPRATRIVRFACARLSSLIPSSIACVAQAARSSHVQLGYASDKMCVIHNGYDFDVYRQAISAREKKRSQFGVGATEVLIGSVGRWHPDKGHDVLLAALGQVCAQHPTAKAVLIGRGLVPGNHELIQLLRNHGLQERVILKGERSDVPECLAAMDIYCLHSRREAFPNALAEAMASALPCVAADVGDAALLLAGTGCLVPPGDVGSLASALCALLRMTEDDRRQMGRQAAHHIQQDYSLEACRLKFERLYSLEGST
ncbi:MAG: glycosyltransferase [Aquabacterium sp.]|nr:glycosyltransferase [Aquabacterium sp.]